LSPQSKTKNSPHPFNSKTFSKLQNNHMTLVQGSNNDVKFTSSTTTQLGLNWKENELNSKQQTTQQPQLMKNFSSTRSLNIQNGSDTKNLSLLQNGKSMNTPPPKNERLSLQEWMKSPEFQVEIPLDPYVFFFVRYSDVNFLSHTFVFIARLLL
jgi:hypothetical protein